MAGMVLACAPSFQRDATPDKRRFLNFVSFAELCLHGIAEDGSQPSPCIQMAGWAPHIPAPIIIFITKAAKVYVDI